MNQKMESVLENLWTKIYLKMYKSDTHDEIQGQM